MEELNAGVDERDDDDIESAAPLEEQKRKRKSQRRSIRKKGKDSGNTIGGKCMGRRM
ncbi:MAG: hypothetical protein ACLR0U_22715 [Enterocloster clostridioformis]